MALSGSFETNNVGGLASQYPNRFRFEWSATQNIGGNFSTVSYSLKGHGGTGGGWWVYTWHRRLVINGVLMGDASNQIEMTTGYVLFSGSTNVGHDGAGYKTFNANSTGRIYYGGGDNTSNSVNFSLNRIPKPPTVSTSTVSSVTPTSGYFPGNISDTGGATVTDAGVYVSSVDSTPDAGDLDADSNDNSGSFGATLGGLTPNTLYYYRAYATNSRGTSYGIVRTFTTYELAEVTTDATTSITGTTATANGQLINNGNPDITEKGFVYSTSPTPTTSNNKVTVAGTATGAYNAGLTGLTPSTTYYIRAYAKNTAGTVYGSESSFQTVVPPTLTTNDPSAITTTTADMSGEVLSDGGGIVSERGFVYGTTPAPTTADSKWQVGSGIGIFSDQITGLTPSATYYIRAYAINEGGTGYGNEKSFTAVETNPLQPSNLVPSGGNATDDLTPNLSWQYNPGSANDTQSAYQVIVTRQSDSVQMWDSTKVVSSNQNVDYAGTALVYDVVYQWEVRTWNQADLDSPYSTTVVFKTSELPVATITYPTDTATIPSNTPTFTWTYSDPESTVQVSSRVRVYASDNTTLLHDTGEVLGTDTSYLMPDGILETNNTYNVSVELQDGDGLYSALVSHEFTVVFLAPAQPTISTTADNAGIVDVNITINQPPTDGWYADKITLYKSNDGGLENTQFIVDYMLNVALVDDAEDETLWVEFGDAIAATAGTAKYGTQSVQLATTGTGANSWYKLIDIQNLVDYDTFQVMINVVDNTAYTSIDFRLETDASNYFEIVVASGDLANGVWNPIHVNLENWTQVGEPNPNDINSIKVVIQNPTGAIAVGDILIDEIRLLQSLYTFKDYETANGDDLIYGITARSVEAAVSTGLVQSSLTQVRFLENLYNTYLVPLGSEENMLKGWLDGTSGIPINDRTETQYYEPVGAKYPSVFVNANQQFKDGSLELWFFDVQKGGQGKAGVRVFEDIKNIKPILLRTWWGDNYWISVDGVISVNRKPGIGWSAGFSFKEIGNG